MARGERPAGFRLAALIRLGYNRDMVSDPDTGKDIYVPLAGTRAQSIHRLQIGLAGLGAMALLVGLANVIMNRAKQTDASAVPESAAPVAAVPPAASDPLADAGVAPDVVADPTPTPVITLGPNAIPPPRKP
jgi:hypothetical protein